MTTLFISDLHLEETRPDTTSAFCNFLREKTANIDALYILGDFFEVWLGDDADGCDCSRKRAMTGIRALAYGVR